MERKTAISVLNDIKNWAEKDKRIVYAEALTIAINSLMTDEAYQLEYERTTKGDLPHCQHTDEEIAKSFIEDVEAVKEQLPCGEQMDFPNTFDEFANEYGFKDKDEVYTNGSQLIQVFRVKQWLEHISTTKNDLGVDCISRADAIHAISEALERTFVEHEDIANKLIGKLPSVTPQEPRKGHWIITNDYLTTAYGSIDYVKCSCCGEDSLEEGDYCPNCGAKMVEPQESEDKE